MESIFDSATLAVSGSVWAKSGSEKLTKTRIKKRSLTIPKFRLFG
jgi:hypothetical protein